MTGTEFRRLRQRLGLTQKALARALGVTETAVAYWERGLRKIGEPAARLTRLLVQQASNRPKGRD